MMFKSANNEHVVWFPPGMLLHGDTLYGGWYFWDETEQLGGGPHHTELQATQALREYAEQLDKGG